MEALLQSFLGDNLLTLVLYASLPLVLILLYALLAILGEVKISAWMQDRLGPMRTGPWGIIQPLADVLKLLQKEDIVPEKADKFLFNLAPYLSFMSAYAAFAVIPFSSQYVGADLNIGLFYLLAISSLNVAAIMMAGWASNNKYSLYGAMRGVAQIVSYEVPAAMALVIIVIFLGSLNISDVITAQSGPVWNWMIFGGPKQDVMLASGTVFSASWVNLVFAPFFIATFVMYYVSGLAETNRTPFDIPEAESELVSGYHTEYSGMKFAMFFMSEYANMFLVSIVTSILFFGGWNSPFGAYLGDAVGLPWLTAVEQLGWLVFKGLFFVFVMIWIRWTLPRLRVDQLMYMCWKVLIPFSFGIALIVGFLVVVL
ncbi:MAG: NADH-quinone oxidoreductase subunit H [Bacteroidetes bacterium]|nr:NADH-quinone oxidoreductase subunit H [Bacteroidota bacterium]